MYGYSGWCDTMGYISMHNPTNQVRTFTIKMNRAIGINKNVQNFAVSSPISGDTDGLKPNWSYGDTMTIKLQPKEIRILTFKK